MSTAPECSNVATARRAASVRVEGTRDGSQALELTARPVGADAAAYLVEVFVENGAPKLLGSFSFFPARVGKAETFVLPTPALEGRASQGLTLSVKLVPANPARALKDAAVEIVSARLTE